MFSKKYRLSYLPLFYDDLDEKVTYIAEKLKNPKAANDLLDKVESAIMERLPLAESFEPYHSVRERSYYYEAATCVKIIESVKEYIEKDYSTFEQKNRIDVDSSLNIIFSHFYKVARQLRCRYDNRETLKIEDEYDVQDLLHALLLLYFDDIRAEEWTSSYAGKSARMDFLLKNEGVVIEVKKTRLGLTDKELGDQLIIDVDRYKVHPDCKRLVCFVYDAEGRIGNPNGLMADLNNQHEGFATVIIKPDM